MKLLLTSAGIRNDAITDALRALVGKPFAETKVLFVTTAANTGHDDKRWLIEDLERFADTDFHSIDILDFAGLPEEVVLPHFETADVICVGGGDERYLARMFAAHGFAEKLPKWLKTKVYMGISAGSMVVGQYLTPSLSAQIFPEEDFGDATGEGLGLVPFAFIPHLNSDFFSLRKERLQGLEMEFTCPVYATDDETAVMVVDGVVTKIGEGEFLEYSAVVVGPL
jgi:dipeptidase E